jgi:hypothetical protein
MYVPRHGSTCVTRQRKGCELQLDLQPSWVVTHHRCSLYFKIASLLQVPSVLREDLPQREAPWGKQTKALLGGSTTLELSDAVSVSLTFRPLGVTVLVHGQPAVTFNSRQMFAMEHSVEKKVQSTHHCFCCTFMPPALELQRLLRLQSAGIQMLNVCNTMCFLVCFSDSSP